MDARHDAACAAAEWVLAVEAAARREPGLVATVGRLQARPGAPNVVPGAAVASLDVRHADDAVRAAAVAALRARGAADRRRARRRGRVARGHERAGGGDGRRARPAAGRGGGRARAAGACALASGAGHDAVALAALTGVAMLFVRCAGGISHHPDESVDEADVGVALDVLHALRRAGWRA